MLDVLQDVAKNRQIERWLRACAGPGFLLAASIAIANPVSDENRHPGDSGWQGPRRSFDANYDSLSYIKGYASATSVNKNQSIKLFVSVNNVDPSFSISIYRLGYYQGLGGRLMMTYPASGYAVGSQQPTCPIDRGPPAGDGMVQCRWSPAYVLHVPDGWTSGMYVAKLRLKNPPPNAPGYNYIVFVVRDDARRSDIVYQQPVATYQAYNRYGGSSLYGCYVSACTHGEAAHKASFDRPYARDGLGPLFSWEQPLIFWLERAGYDIAYTTDIDTHEDGARIERSKIFLTAGHGEYWSKQMYDAVENARDRGVHLAFLGGNTLYWQARFEASPMTGESNRVIAVYRSIQLDPIPNPALKTIQWRNLGRPEQSLLGLQWANGKSFSSAKDAVPWVVADADHWIYAGTGVREKQILEGIIGQEWDTVYADRNGLVPDYVGKPGTFPPGYTAAMPPYLTFDIVEHSTLLPAQVAYPPPAYHLPLTTDAVVYQSLSGAYVFSAGSVLWGTLGTRSGILQTVTSNVLDKMLATVPQRLDIRIVNAITDVLLLAD
ncbi:MAG: hypothetical protein NVS9B2_18120 [Steroidobacteraceae bacterium]